MAGERYAVRIGEAVWSLGAEGLVELVVVLMRLGKPGNAAADRQYAAVVEAARPPSGAAPSDGEQEPAPKRRVPSITFDYDTAQFHGITDKRRALWRQAYPAVDIDLELLKAAAWLVANPAQRKKNYARFLTNWLSRCQERGGSSPGRAGGSAGGVANGVVNGVVKSATAALGDLKGARAGGRHE